MPIHSTPAGPVETLEWGDGPVLVVLLHAAAAGPGSLSALGRALAGPGRRVVAPALHGYGATRVAGATGPIAAHAAVARAVLALYPAGRRLLFGHSMGGLAALLAADQADAIAVHEPIVTGLLRDDDPDDGAARDWDRAIVAELGRQVRAGRAEAGVRAFVSAWNELRWETLPDTARQRLITAAATLLAEVEAGSFHPAPPAPRAGSLLILQGALSPLVTHRMTARLRMAAPGAERVILPGCGHMGPVTAAPAVAAALAPMLTRLDGG